MTTTVSYPATAPVLAIDFGMPCGLAGGAKGFMFSTTVKMRRRNGVLPLGSLFESLEKAAAAIGATKLAYRVAKSRARARNDLSETQGKVVEWARARRLELMPIRDMKLRRAFGVGGNSAEVEMGYAALNRGFDPASIAEANAIALLHLAVCSGDPAAETIVTSR